MKDLDFSSKLIRIFHRSFVKIFLLAKIVPKNLISKKLAVSIFHISASKRYNLISTNFEGRKKDKINFKNQICHL